LTDRPALDAIVFDAGGTLVRLDFEWIQEMLAELGVRTTLEHLRRSEVEGRRRYDAAASGMPRALAPGEAHPPLGSVGPSDAYLGGMLETVGVPAELLEESLAQVWAYQKSDRFLWGRPVEGARAMLDALPALGVRAACVSNADGRAERILESCGVREGLEFVVDSQIVGVEKPDPRIFHLALERLKISPDRALYVGDIRSVDQAGARAAGMHFVLIDPYGNYGEPGMHRISNIAELPAFVTSAFTTPASTGPAPQR
jgi:putative hydrolase of the HAD superfamily